MTVIVDSLEPITLVGAGTLTKSDLESCLRLAPKVVAADGGAVHCRKFGHIPEAVIGDMDSLEAADIAAIAPERLHHIAEQNSTDFDKALRSITAPVVLGAGFAGARVDHQLACYNALVRHPDRRCVLLSDADITFLAPPKLCLKLGAGTRVSLFPMGSVSGTSEGLRWEIDGLAFAPDGSIGTSNEAVGAVTLTFSAPHMLVILPREWLAEVVRTLRAQAVSQTGGWPAL